MGNNPFGTDSIGGYEGVRTDWTERLTLAARRRVELLGRRLRATAD